MPAMTTHIPGTFCWPELCSADVAGIEEVLCFVVRMGI